MVNELSFLTTSTTVTSYAVNTAHCYFTILFLHSSVSSSNLFSVCAPFESPSFLPMLFKSCRMFIQVVFVFAVAFSLPRDALHGNSLAGISG